MKSVLPWILIAALQTGLLPRSAEADGPWTGAGGEALPFRTDEEIRAFLREAEAEKVKVLTSGINRPLKVLLRKDGVEAHAVFRTVDVQRDRLVIDGELYRDFHDSYLYECAAYEMSRLLGFDNVPPCVVRRLWRQRGSLQLWIEDTTTEADRIRQGTRASSAIFWVRQVQVLRVFDALIRNFDRHHANMLIDPDGKLWLIDHGRSFHKSPKIDRIKRLIWCERQMWERLKSLDRKAILERAGDFLQRSEIAFLLGRRDAIVRHFEERMAELGEDSVLYRASDPPPEGIENDPDFARAGSTDDIPATSALPEGGG